MVKFQYLILVTVFIVIIEDINCSSSIADTLSRYYESELQKSFKGAWQKYKIPYEHALATNLKENVGVFPMNVYLRHDTNPRFISAGCYFTDNVVDVLLFGLTLRDMPHLIMPEVTLAPASNLLRLEGSLSKIFIDTHYYIARNDSTISQVNRMEPQENNSPFSLEQVQRLGSLTIIAEDCFLSGFSIITLVGTSLNVGHSPMRIFDCKFTIEVSSNDMSTPPVIAPYFPEGPDSFHYICCKTFPLGKFHDSRTMGYFSFPYGHKLLRMGSKLLPNFVAKTSTAKMIEGLLTKAFLSVLVPKIQGTVYTFVNTSEIFGDDLNEYRFHQQTLFMQTANYMSDVCVKLNNLTLQGSKGHIRMSSLSESYEMVTDSVLSSIEVTLDEMMLYGLDTAYATRTGGSFEATRLSIADAIRFNSLQIRGKSKYLNSSQSELHDFAAEVTDVTVNVVLNMDMNGSRVTHKFEFAGWRKLDFSILPWQVERKIRVWYQSLVTGYILNEIPDRIIEHLSNVLTPAANEGDESDAKIGGLGTHADSEKDVDEDQYNDNQNEDDDADNNGDTDKNKGIDDEINGNNNGGNESKENNENQNNDDDDGDVYQNNDNQEEDDDAENTGDTDRNEDIDDENNGNDSANDHSTNDSKDNNNNDDDSDENKLNDKDENGSDIADEKIDSGINSNTKNILIFDSDENGKENSNDIDNDNNRPSGDKHDKNNENEEGDNNNGDDNKDSNSDSNTQNYNNTFVFHSKEKEEDIIEEGHDNDIKDGDNNNDDEKEDSNSDNNMQNGTKNILVFASDNNEKGNDEDNTEEELHHDNREGDNNNYDDKDNSNSNISTQNGTEDNIEGHSNGNIKRDNSNDDSGTEIDGPVSEIDEDKNDNADVDNGVTSDPDIAMEGDNDSKQSNNDDNENEMKIEKNKSDNNYKNVLISGNGDTKLAARIGKESNNLKVHLDNTRHGMQNKTLKGLSLKRLRSNNVRLGLTNNNNIAKKYSVKKPVKMKINSPHTSENDLIR